MVARGHGRSAGGQRVRTVRASVRRDARLELRAGREQRHGGDRVRAASRRRPAGRRGDRAGAVVRGIGLGGAAAGGRPGLRRRRPRDVSARSRSHRGGHHAANDGDRHRSLRRVSGRPGSDRQDRPQAQAGPDRGCRPRTGQPVAGQGRRVVRRLRHVQLPAVQVADGRRGRHRAVPDAGALAPRLPLQQPWADGVEGLLRLLVPVVEPPPDRPAGGRCSTANWRSSVGNWPCGSGPART